MPKGRRKSKKDKAEEGAYKLKFSISGPDFSLSTVGTASAAFIAQGKIGFHAPGLGAQQQQQDQVAGAKVQEEQEDVGVGGAAAEPEAVKGKSPEPLPEEREKEGEEVQPAQAPQLAPGSAVRSGHPLEAVQLKGALPPSSHVPPGVAVAKAALPSPPKTTPRCALPAAHAAAANAFDAASSNRASPSRSSRSSASTRPTPTPLPRSPARPPSQLTSSSARADCTFAARRSSPASPAGRLAPAAQPDSRPSPASPFSPHISAELPPPPSSPGHAACSGPSKPRPWLLPANERDEYISLAVDLSYATLRDPSTKKPPRMLGLEDMVREPPREKGRKGPGREHEELDNAGESDDEMSDAGGEGALEERFVDDLLARLETRVDAHLLREKEQAQEEKRKQEERERAEREREEREWEEREREKAHEQKERAARKRERVKWEQEALEQDEWEQDTPEPEEHCDTREREHEKAERRIERKDAATAAGAKLAGIAALQAAAARPADLAYHVKLRDSLLAFKYAEEDPPTRSPPFATARLPSSARDPWRTNVPPLVLPPPVVAPSPRFGPQEGGKIKTGYRDPVIAIKDTFLRDSVDYVAGLTKKGKNCKVEADKVKGTAAAAVWNHQVDVAIDLHRSARRARYVERGLYTAGGAKALKPAGKTPWGPTSAAGLNKRAGSAVFASGASSAPASSARSPSGSAATRPPPAHAPSTRPTAPPRNQPRKLLEPVVPPPRSFSLAPRAHGASTPYSSSPPFALTQRRATLPQNAAEQNRGRAGPRKRATSAPGDDKRAGKKRKKEVEARALEKKAKRRRSRGASTAADIEATGGGTDPIVEDEE